MTHRLQRESGRNGENPSPEEGSHKLPPALLLRLSRFIEEKMGLAFPGERHADLERHVRDTAREAGYDDTASYVGRLLSSPSSQTGIEALAANITVGETYFFRDAGSLDTVAEAIVPEIIRLRKKEDRRIRIWSAGCSTGEEPYSIAILLDKILPEPAGRHVTLLATDINPRSLEKAAKGIYSPWSFRDTPEWVREGYFTKTKKGFEIVRRIKKMVTFSYHNLAHDPYPSLVNNTSAMDIIFCRNVLMYFSRERAKRVARQFSMSLVDDGWLVINPIEGSQGILSPFKGVRFPQATLYRKTGAKEAVAPAEEDEPGKMDPLKDIRPHKTKTVGDTPAGSMAATSADPVETVVFARPVTKVATPEPQGALSDLAFEARSAADRGRLPEALELCQKAIDRNKLSRSLYFLKGTILNEIGRTTEAAASFRRAIYVDRDFVLAHFALGSLMCRQGKPEEAEKCFENATLLLKSYGEADTLPESEGISAGRLAEIIETIRRTGGRRNS